MNWPRIYPVGETVRTLSRVFYSASLKGVCVKVCVVHGLSRKVGVDVDVDTDRSRSCNLPVCLLDSYDKDREGYIPLE